MNGQTMSIKWAMRRHPDGTYTGEIYVPIMQMGGGIKYLKTMSAQPGSPAAPTSKGAALSQAAGLAQKIIGNPLLQAALPPGTGVAVQAIKKLADSEAVGKLASAAKDIVGKGAKRLASALKFW